MTPQEFLSLIDQTLRTDGPASGAAWEINAQVDIWNKLITSGFSAQREMLYPGSKFDRVDFAFSDRSTAALHFVELKVEGATTIRQFAGKPMDTAVTTDIEKLKKFDPASLLGDGHTSANRWVVAVAWSPRAKEDIWASRLFHNKLEGKVFCYGLTIL